MTVPLTTPTHVVERLRNLARDAGYSGRDLDRMLDQIGLAGTAQEAVNRARVVAQQHGYTTEARPLLEQVQREIPSTNGHTPVSSTMDNAELLRRVFAKARDIASKAGYCDTAEDIIGKIEDAFAVETHPAFALAKDFANKVDNEDWAGDADIVDLVSHGFRAGWDAAQAKA